MCELTGNMEDATVFRGMAPIRLSNGAVIPGVDPIADYDLLDMFEYDGPELWETIATHETEQKEARDLYEKRLEAAKRELRIRRYERAWRQNPLNPANGADEDEA